MQYDRSKRIDEIFHAALELEPSARAAFLAEVCKEDTSLLPDVEEKLSVHENNPTLFEVTTADPVTELISAEREFTSSISHYQILRKISSGGMGNVYLAEDTRLNRKVALKLLPSQFTRDKARVKRFEREARAASALNHPNILTVYDIGQIYSSSFMVSEYIEGETLRQKMWKGNMSLNEILDIGIQVAEALDAAHQAGIIHRDIKPENIMLRKDGYIKVLDFGLAKLTGTQRSLTLPDVELLSSHDTLPGTVVGTVRYMSPEQAQGFKVDSRSDIFSLGVVLYEMLTSRPPFDGATTSDLILALTEKNPDPLHNYRDDLPSEVEPIITKALAKSTSERYQTAKDLLMELKRLLKRIEIEEELRQIYKAPISLPEKLKSTTNSNFVVTGWIIGIAALLILLYCLFFFFKS